MHFANIWILTGWLAMQMAIRCSSSHQPDVLFGQGSLRGLGEEILWLHCVSASALRRILEVNRYVFAHILWFTVLPELVGKSWQIRPENNCFLKKLKHWSILFTTAWFKPKKKSPMSWWHQKIPIKSTLNHQKIWVKSTSCWTCCCWTEDFYFDQSFQGRGFSNGVPLWRWPLEGVGSPHSMVLAYMY